MKRKTIMTLKTEEKINLIKDDENIEKFKEPLYRSTTKNVVFSKECNLLCEIFFCVEVFKIKSVKRYILF